MKIINYYKISRNEENGSFKSPSVNYRELDKSNLSNNKPFHIIPHTINNDEDKDSLKRKLIKVKTRISSFNINIEHAKEREKLTRSMINENADNESTEKQESHRESKLRENNIFQSGDFEILNALSGINHEYIIPSINHYRELEDQFKMWSKEFKNNKDIPYPNIEINPLKDDIMEYQINS